MEFEALLGKGGTMRLPRHVRQALGTMNGRRVRVRLEIAQPQGRLQEPGVIEEIERIAALQMEPREVVMRIFLSEGVLQNSSRFKGALRRSLRGQGGGR